MKKRHYVCYSAFTLSEVLITLGIIGVVAALTIPSVIANYNRKVWVNQLKKSVSVVEQGFQKMLADDGVEWLQDTSVFQSIGASSCHTADSMSSKNCSAFYNSLNKYYKIIDIKKSSDSEYQMRYIKKGSKYMYPEIDNKGPSRLIILNDGSFITNYVFYKNINPSYTCEKIKNLGGHMCYKVAYLTIDVNGKRGPNIEGRDIFDFNVSEKGKLIPFWSTDSVIYAYLNPKKSWRYDKTACGTPGRADAEQYATYGSGCAARVIENGWEMDY